jgi:23S rRNA pseudouridine2604 synthase
MAEPVRLAKRVAAMLPCSRREAEQYIEGGWVRVEGQVIEEPQFRVGEDQRVELDAGASPAALEPVTLLLHKPAGLPYGEAQRLLGPASRSPQDASGIRTVKKHFAQLTPLMAMLDEASGLTVFSQDHRIVRKLTEDERVIEQELVAQVSGTIVAGGLERLCQGLVFNGKPLPPAKVSWQNETRLRFALKGISPGQVGWMCEQVGLRLLALKRIRLGRLPMAGLLPGQWRYLHPGERF